MIMRTAIQCTTFALLSISFNSIAAAAEPALITSQRVVKFGDLDLHREAGVAALYGRLRSAAPQVCGSSNPRGLAPIAAASRCMRQSMDRAVADVGSPGLTSYHLRQTGQPILLAQTR